jgi:hypothetical protein
LLTTVSIKRVRASFVAQAMWGVTIQSWHATGDYRDLAAREGSTRRIDDKCPGFILDKDAALIIPRVCGSGGQCKLTSSATGINYSTLHQRKPDH